MSNAISQSATNLAVSPAAGGEEKWDFSASVKRQADRTAKGTTRERLLLNRNKLVSGACAEYRSHFASVYGKSERLPREIFTQIESAVDEFLEKQLKQVNIANVIGMRRSFFHNYRQMEVVERVNITGENKIVLKEQLFGINCFINQAEKRLKELEKKPTPDYDREKAIRQQIMQMNLTKDYILGEIKHQEKLAEDAKAVTTK